MMERVESYISSFLQDYQDYKTSWNYEDGCVLVGAIRLYEATQKEAYRKFVLSYLDRRVEPDGTIPSFSVSQYSIDNINAGKALFFGLKETGEEKYRKAIEFHMERLKGHPRCKCGNFWHKEVYPNQIWLDGLYMAQPFYMAYEKEFDHYAHLSDITSQFQNVRKYLYDSSKGLYYHGFDESRQQPWCDPQTGLSKNFWLRAMGWYLMALVDCIELCSEELYEHYRVLVDILREAITGLLKYQDPETGLFYQVIDHPEVDGNYLETSGSAMVACSILKGVRLGALDEKYRETGIRIFESLVQRELRETDGTLHLCDICRVAGLGPGEKRDGSIAYYLSEEICMDDSKGVGPFFMAYAEYVRAKG